jgi:cell shape-determining protein MreD
MRVFVILYQTRLVGVGMCMGLPPVAVFVLVFNVVVIVQDVGVRMCDILVGVFMDVLGSHHPCSIPDAIASDEVPRS